MPPRLQPQQPVTSPCIGICSLDDDAVCKGCARTLDEISRWTRMTTNEQVAVIRQIEHRRQAKEAQQ